MTEFQRLRQQLVFEYLDRFPAHGTRTITKKLYKEHPEFFIDYEAARSYVRYYRGQKGDKLKKKVISGGNYKPKLTRELPGTI